jgi:hypothetical protein
MLYGCPMVLLSGLMRAQAVTGRTDTLFTRVSARQGGRWAEQRVQRAVRPPSGAGAAAPPPDPARQLNELRGLRDSGVVSDEEFELLRGRLHA